MEQRKAAVVGSKFGPWVAAYALKGLGLEVIGTEDTVVETQLRGDAGACSVVTNGPGVHPLIDANWARSTVHKGEGTMCFLVSGVSCES